jgi:hypothetical protein
MKNFNILATFPIATVSASAAAVGATRIPVDAQIQHGNFFEDRPSRKPRITLVACTYWICADAYTFALCIGDNVEGRKREATGNRYTCVAALATPIFKSHMQTCH